MANFKNSINEKYITKPRVSRLRHNVLSWYVYINADAKDEEQDYISLQLIDNLKDQAKELKRVAKRFEELAKKHKRDNIFLDISLD